jgi:hypothetical protein
MGFLPEVPMRNTLFELVLLFRLLALKIYMQASIVVSASPFLCSIFLWIHCADHHTLALQERKEAAAAAAAAAAAERVLLQAF